MNNSSINNSVVEDHEFDPSIPEDERRFYLKAYPNVNHVRERKVHCTICKMHIGTAPCNESIIRMHPILRVTHCKKCHDFYNSGEFSKGEDGSELYCRWCGQGGEVYCCSNCPFVFCKSCIISNLSRGVVADIEQNENWSCFNCAPKMLWPLRAQHWALNKFIDKQKKAILNSNLSDAEIKVQMTKDRSLCCKIKKTSGYGTDSSESSDVSLSRLKKKVGDKRSRKSLSKEDLSGGASQSQVKKLKSNDEVVCTPDVLSMLEPECTLTVPANAKPPINQQPSAPSPKIMSIQPAKRICTPPLLVRSAPSPVVRPPAPVLKKTVIGPRMPAGQGSDFNTPVYHTINGYRIDLNSAAQQETVRLPNGKLIQVKRQGTGPQAVTTVQNAPNQHSTPTRVIHNITGPGVSPIANVPAQQIVHSSGGHIIRAQLQTPRSMTIQNPAIVPQFPQQHQQQPQQQQQQPLQQQPVQPQYQQITIRQPNQQMTTIRYQGNTTQQQMSNMIQNGTMQILNGTQVTAPGGQIPTVRPMPTFMKQFFPNTPLGQSRTQLQNQIFNAMEICQHLMGKLQTLTNSNAYKTAKSMTDVKELYIHLSYLLTYAIGRFKGLQDNCLADMRDLGFTNDANSLENGQLAAGMNMVRNGIITDFSNVDLESFHSLIVQNMKLPDSDYSSKKSKGQTEASTEGSKKLTHLNYNRMIIGQNGNHTTQSGSGVKENDDDEDCLLVEIPKYNSPEQIDIQSESDEEDNEDEEEEDCLLVELGDRHSEKHTPPTTPTMMEEDYEENDYVHPGLVTLYEKDDDYEKCGQEYRANGSGLFTTELDIKLIEILKNYPLLWYPQETRTKFHTMDSLWKKINKQMPRGLNNRERWKTIKRSYKKSQRKRLTTPHMYADHLRFLNEPISRLAKKVSKQQQQEEIEEEEKDENEEMEERLMQKQERRSRDVRDSKGFKNLNNNSQHNKSKNQYSSKNNSSKTNNSLNDSRPVINPFEDYDFIVKMIKVVKKYPGLWHPKSDMVLKRRPQPKIWQRAFNEINDPRYNVEKLKIKWKTLKACHTKNNLSAEPFRKFLHFLSDDTIEYQPCNDGD